MPLHVCAQTCACGLTLDLIIRGKAQELWAQCPVEGFGCQAVQVEQYRRNVDDHHGIHAVQGLPQGIDHGRWMPCLCDFERCIQAETVGERRSAEVIAALAAGTERCTACPASLRIVVD